MRVLYYDCFSGISGDMNLAAMIDIGIGEDYLRAELQKLNLQGWELEVTKDQRHGIFGTRVNVKQTKEEHIHRHMSDIEEILHNSSLDKKVQELSLKIFSVVAEAEATVHNTTPDKIHFHEVGAIDSIVDIVGAAICYLKLEVDEVIVSRVELGGGFVKCAHGTLPVPAPATAEIVKGIPVSTEGVNFEATTPTGAAILKTLGTMFSEGADLEITSTGYGIGHKSNPDRPNMIRLYLGEIEKRSIEGDSSSILECNIDDMNPEWYDSLITRLIDGGASDVYLTQIIMKKGRPGTKISVLSNQGKIEALKEILFKHSTTLGVRIIPVKKHTLEREFKKVKTEFGDVTVKYGYFKGEIVSIKPEHNDCLIISKREDISLKEVTRIVLLEANKQP